MKRTKKLKCLFAILAALSINACNNPKAIKEEDNLVDSLKTANKELAVKLEMAAHGPGMTHDISLNIAAFLMQNYNPLTGSSGSTYSVKYGIGGFFSSETLKSLSEVDSGITTFLCLDANSQFYISAIAKNYNVNCGNVTDSCGLADDVILYKSSNNLKNPYGGNGNPDLRALKNYLMTPNLFKLIDPNGTDTWANIKKDVELFDQVYEKRNATWCNYLARNDVDMLMTELGDGKGVFCTLGYDDSEDKNQLRLIFYQVDKDGNLGTANKLILERMWP